MAELSPNLISDALGQEPNAVFYSVTKSVAESLPGWAIAETQSAAFDPYAFAFDGRCTLEKRDDVFAQSLLDYEGGKDQSSLWLTHGVYDVRWNEHSLLLVIATIVGSYCPTRHCAIFAEEKQVADEFFLECCRWNSEVRGEILVFSGAWYKDPQLYEAIKSATFQSLILEGTLKEELIRDFHLFLDSKAVYRKHKIPWKRGILLLGPPGNGKTHAIKSLANSIGIPSLYVKSFSHPHATDQQQIQEVFKKARESAPCLLIFEDLDSLLTDGNRSFFLNEMDGFASNDGILTIATTNHPERLDPAILERPSRFDRKYTFNLPALTERLAYLAFQNESLEPELRMSQVELEQVAEITEEFSFAYLKELVLSSMMLWINQKNVNMKDLMVSQVKTLLQQMKTAPPAAEYLDENDPNIAMKRYRQRWQSS